MKKYITLKPFKVAALSFKQGDEVEPFQEDNKKLFAGFLTENGFVKEVIDEVETIEDMAVDTSSRSQWELDLDAFLLKNFDRWVFCTDDPNAPTDYAQDCACCFGTEIKNCNCICHTRIKKLKEYIALNIIKPTIQ